MKPVFRLLVFALLLVGCTKEFPIDVADSTSTEEPQTEPTYTPTGNLVLYVDSLGMMPFSETDACCTHLCFAIYDMDGARVKQTNQKLGDNHYGAVGIRLDEGVYRVVVVAHSGTKNPTMTNPAKIQFNSSTGYTDTYLYHDTVKVTASQQRLHLALRRITALCRFVVSDTVPDGVTQMQYTWQGGSAHFDAATGLGVTVSTQTVTCDVLPGQTDLRTDLYTIPFSSEEDTLRLEVVALDADGNRVAERTFSVPIRYNRITWLAGCFFSESNSDEWTITPDQNFDSSWPDEMYLTY